MLYLLAVALPALVMAMMQAIPFKRSYLRAHDLHHALMSLATAICFAYLLTEFGKYYVGRLRPDFQSRVAMMDGVDGGQKSFPSRHSSKTFAGMTSLALYVAGKLGLFSDAATSHTWQLLVFLLPIFVAFWVATSRVRDYRHHPSDILGGSLIGLGVGFAAHRMYFGSLFSANTGVPKN